METPVKCYTLRLELPNSQTAIEAQGDDLVVIKDTAQTILKGGCRFESFGSSGTTLLVYHPTVEGGKKAIGWIGNFEIPEAMSNWTQSRIRQAA